MTKLPAKVESRITAGLKKYQKVLTDARNRDVNESDTVLIITDFLNEVLGFDKYTDITTEYCIRGGYCDLAVKFGAEVQYLIEVKAIGTSLKDTHLRQVLTYSAQEGINWVILTNGRSWQAHKLHFEQPIRNEMIFEIDLLSVGARDREAVQHMFLLSKEGMAKSAIQAFKEQKDACSPFLVAQILLSDSLLGTIRRELRRISPDARITPEEIASLMKESVVKRELVDGEDAKSAATRLKRAATRSLRKAKDEPSPSLPAGIEAPT